MARSKDSDEQKALSKSLNSNKKRPYNKRSKAEPETNSNMAKTSKDSKKEEGQGTNETSSQESVQNTETVQNSQNSNEVKAPGSENNNPVVQETKLPIVEQNNNTGTGDQSQQVSIGEEKIKDPNAQPNTDYNPLGSNVDEKNYMKKPEIAGAPEEVSEPMFNMETVNPIETQKKVEASTTQTLPPNPALNELDQAGKRLAAEQLVDLVLKGYSRLLDLGKWFVRVDKEQIMEMQIDGKNDPNFTLPMDETGKVQITLEEYVTTYNKQSSEALTVSLDFLNKVREPMIRLCIKKGWGVTDEEYLIYLWGEELAVKGSMVVGFKRSMNKTLNLWTKLYYTHTNRDHNGNPLIQQNNQQNNNHQNNSNQNTEKASANNKGRTADDEVVSEKKKEQVVVKKEETNNAGENNNANEELANITTPVPH